MVDIECPVCCDQIIGPYSLSCGHTICSKCFFMLHQSKCPTCRSTFDKSLTSPNLLLEDFLRTRIDKYDECRAKYTHDIKLYRCRSTYKKSTRYNELKDKINDFFNDNQGYINLTEIDRFFTDVSLDELHHVINLMPSLTVMSLQDMTFIIDCDTLKSFVTDYAEYLIDHPLEYIHLISVCTEEEDDSDPDYGITTLTKAVGFTTDIYEKRLLPESETFDEWITNISGLEEYSDQSEDRFFISSITNV